MDTSKEYIAMCDCEEVQGGWEPTWGDWYWDDDVQIVDLDDGHKAMLKHELECYKTQCAPKWLPRQDQIQEMLEVDSVRAFEFAVYDMFFEGDGYHHCNSEPEWITDELKTPEQLWLAFYMQEKYSKVWNGTKWT